MNNKLKIWGTATGLVVSIFALACLGRPAWGQEPKEDLSACPGSAPEPSQSGTWSVAFCNRTGHDLVMEFHENECPAYDGSRRGDVYQRVLHRGESRTLPLCYANEAGKKLAPGAPALRIPGGKGVTTTWSVVGDCGDHSKSLNMDAKSFYDRGDYKTGIILLQYPAGASHCTSDASTTAPGSAGAASSGAAVAGGSSATAAAPYVANSASPSNGAYNAQPSAPAPSAGQPPVAPHATLAAPPAPPAAPAVPRTGGEPALTASVDTSGLVQHRVQVFAKGGAGYKCNMNLLVTFSDGATWNDKVKVDITGNDEQVPITTRKYLKTPTDVKITTNKCATM